MGCFKILLKGLKDYLVKGYAINQKRLEENKTQFLQTLEDLKFLYI